MTTLAKFLAAKEPLFDHALQQLELRTQKQGVDVRLAAEIASKAAEKTMALGLPPECRGQDLYRALIEKAKEHDHHLVKLIGGGDDPTDVVRLLPIIQSRAEKLHIKKDGFFIRYEVAADMLQKTPPPGIMARLGYDDVRAMLSKEDLPEIYLALRFAEEPAWLNKFNEQAASLKADDFEVRDIRLIRYDPDKWGDIAKHFIEQKFHNITNSKEIGAIAMMPMTIEHMPGVAIKDLSLIVHYYNEIRLYSAFFKLMKAKRNFGQIIAATLNADPSHAAVVAGQNIHWRVIQRYFGKHPDGHPEIFEPHLQPEDLHWRKAESVLYDIDPELGFWRDLDYVAALKGDDTVTFNVLDVAFSYSNQLSYADRYIYHFRESLWNEVFARYFSQQILEEQLLEKLDNALIKPEELKL